MALRANVGLSRAAQLALAATALAPVLIVWAAASWTSAPGAAAKAAGVAVLMVAACLFLLSTARRGLQADPLVVKKASRRDKDVLAFLVTYAMPLVAGKDYANSGLALLAFGLAVGLVLLQLQIFHVNPLLGIFGYHFYDVEQADGDTVLVMARSRSLPAEGAVSGQQLAPGFWLI